MLRSIISQYKKYCPPILVDLREISYGLVTSFKMADRTIFIQSLSFLRGFTNADRESTIAPFPGETGIPSD
jgi:hypothetical protein